MKTPVKCPKCREPLLNIALELRTGSNAWEKICNNKLDHSFVCITRDGDNSIIAAGMTLNCDKSLKVCWNFVRNKIIVHKSDSVVVPFPGKGSLEIPWFEPNLNEYDNLIDKIKKYITFS